MVSRNEFPARPVPGVNALVFRDGTVLLVKRRDEPNKGLWSPPGGSLEIGETVEVAAAREALEETGVVARPVGVAEIRDVILRDGSGRVQWHYVLFGVLCEYVTGEPYPASDAENARFLPLKELGEYELVEGAPEAIEHVMRTRSP